MKTFICLCEPKFPLAALLCNSVSPSAAGGMQRSHAPGLWPRRSRTRRPRSKEKSCDVSGQRGHAAGGTGAALPSSAEQRRKKTTPRGSGSLGESLAKVFAQVIRKPVAGAGGKAGSTRHLPGIAGLEMRGISQRRTM